MKNKVGKTVERKLMEVFIWTFRMLDNKDFLVDQCGKHYNKARINNKDLLVISTKPKLHNLINKRLFVKNPELNNFYLGKKQTFVGFILFITTHHQDIHCEYLMHMIFNSRVH